MQTFVYILYSQPHNPCKSLCHHFLGQMLQAIKELLNIYFEISPTLKAVKKMVDEKRTKS